MDEKAMTNPTEILKGAFASTTRAYNAALQHGLKIGERDMWGKLTPLMRELIDALDNYAPGDRKGHDQCEELIARAGQLLKDTMPEGENND